MNAWLTLNDRKGVVCRALLAAVSGAAATLGFAPYGLWFMTVIAAVAVFYTVEKSRSVREAAGLGWLWGPKPNGPISPMAVYGGVGDVVAAGGVLVMASVLALTYAVPAAAGRWVRKSSGTAALGLPVLWVLAEIIRSDVLGFGWLTTGYAFDTTILAAWAPVAACMPWLLRDS